MPSTSPGRTVQALTAAASTFLAAALPPAMTVLVPGCERAPAQKQAFQPTLGHTSIGADCIRANDAERLRAVVVRLNQEKTGSGDTVLRAITALGALVAEGYRMERDSNTASEFPDLHRKYAIEEVELNPEGFQKWLPQEIAEIRANAQEEGLTALSEAASNLYDWLKANPDELSNLGYHSWYLSAKTELPLAQVPPIVAAFARAIEHSILPKQLPEHGQSSDTSETP